MMKKTLLLSALAISAAFSATAQQAIEEPSLTDNWSIGVDGGVTTPLVKHPFFGSMRGAFGANITKQVTPTLGLGVEGQAYVNTSSWGGLHSGNAIDASYVGAFGTANLMNLFCGYQCGVRPFDIDAVAGIGWGHKYYPEHTSKDANFVASKAGLNFNFNINPAVTITLQPSVMWNMSDAHVGQSTAAYDARKATFNMLAGVTYHIGGENFNCVVPMDPVLIDALNGQINDLRAQLDMASTDAANWQQAAGVLNAQLQACQAQGPTVVETTEVITNNYLNSVRYVFFKIGSSVITADQMPNVEMIASYLKNHPESSVVIKGYASKDGPEEVNIRLANARAQSVKDALINKYKISADRISAEGEGIGNMFTEESWNRVSICTIEDN